MYMVKNVSKNEVVISDMHISLPSGRSIDLDMVKPRYASEQSKYLSMAIKSGMLKVIRKDGETIDPSLIPVVQEDKSNSLIDALKEMEKRLTENINAQVTKTVSDQKEASQTLDVSGLNSAVESLQKIIMNNGIQSTPQQGKIGTQEEIGMDEAMMVDIHTRAVSRMSKNVEGNLRHEEVKEKSNISDNLDELEGLMP